MRPIKFRGKRKDNGEWVYGYYIYRNCVNNDTHYIAIRAGLYYEVIPETVGQFTGLHDKKGQEIYEGDIVGSDKTKMEIVYLSQKEGKTKNDEYINYCWATRNPIDDTFEKIDVWAWSKFEVISNITENPDFLEKERGDRNGL